MRLVVEIKVVLTCHLTIKSIEDGSYVTVVGYGESIDKFDKATSKAMSMLFKCLLIQTFCIPVEGTPDGDDSDSDCSC